MKKMKLLLTAMMLVAIVALTVGCPLVASKPRPTVATPTITLPADTAADWMDFSKDITIKTTTTGTTLHYTVDNTTPTAKSTPLTSSFELSTVGKIAFTLKVIAVRPEYLDSAVATMAFNEKDKVATPVMTPNGGLFNDGDKVVLTSGTPDAKIYYTLDASEPIVGGEKTTEYTDKITLLDEGVDSITVKAIAIRGGFSSTPVSEVFYKHSVEPPVIVGEGLEAKIFNGTLTLNLTSETEDATIYYTSRTDGNAPSDPTVSDTKYDINSKPTFGETDYNKNTIIVKAIAIKDGYADSDVSVKIFTRELVAKPVITPANKVFIGTIDVTLEGAEGATIHYSINDTDTLADFKAYTAPLPIITTTTVRAIAKKEGYTDSEVESATFTLEGTPAIDVTTEDALNFDYATDIIFSNAVTGAEYRYTTDSEEPIASSALAATVDGGENKAKINLHSLGKNGNITVKVSAFVNNVLSPNHVASREFTQIQVEKPTIAPSEGKADKFDYSKPINFTSATTDVTFAYKIASGTEKDLGQGVKTINLETLNITASPVTVTVTAKRDGYADSLPTTLEFTKKTKLGNVTFDSNDKDFVGTRTVTLTHPLLDAKISYTIGDAPTVHPYSAPFTIGETNTLGAIKITAHATHDDYFESDKTPVTFTQRLFETVLVEKGNFMFGAMEAFTYEYIDKDKSANYITGNVTEENGTSTKIENNYYIGIHEVTNKQYAAVMGDIPHTNNLSPGDQAPVNRVSWNQALKFCNELSKDEGLAKYYIIADNGTVTLNQTDLTGYRLPTETEWEYAARGGSQTTSHSLHHSGSNDLNEVARTRIQLDFTNNALRDVGKLKANSLGIYDMSGNVREWCFASGEGNRPVRGGGMDTSKNTAVTRCLVNGSESILPNPDNILGTNTYGYIGFRVIRNAE